MEENINGGDIAENLFKEMDKEKGERKIMVNEGVIETKIDYVCELVGKDKKELRKILKDNAKIKSDMSARIREMIAERAKLTEFNLRLRAELAKKE